MLEQYVARLARTVRTFSCLCQSLSFLRRFQNLFDSNNEEGILMKIGDDCTQFNESIIVKNEVKCLCLRGVVGWSGVV